MEIRKDRKTGIERHTYGTVYPMECRQETMASGLVQGVVVNGVRKNTSEGTEKTDEVVFDILYDGEKMNVISTETRTIVVGMNGRKMLELYNAISGGKWEYDDLGSKHDFV